MCLYSVLPSYTQCLRGVKSVRHDRIDTHRKKEKDVMHFLGGLALGLRNVDRGANRAPCCSLAVPTEVGTLDGSLSDGRPHWRIYTLALKADAGRKEAI